MFGGLKQSKQDEAKSDAVVVNAMNGTFPTVTEPPAPPPATPATDGNSAPVVSGSPQAQSQAQTPAPVAQKPAAVQEPVSANQAPTVTPAQPEPTVEFKKGPFDEPDKAVEVDGVAQNTTQVQQPSADMSDDEKTKALRKSLGLDGGEKEEKSAVVDQAPVQTATEATFPTATQVDEAGVASPVASPLADSEKEKDALEDLMDGIVWDLAGVQAKIRQMKDKIDEYQKNKAVGEVADNEGSVSPLAVETNESTDGNMGSVSNTKADGVAQSVGQEIDDKKNDSAPRKSPNNNPLAGYNIG